MKAKTLLSLCLLAAGIVLSAQSLPPEIRKSTEKPFDAKGRAIESAWKNADTLTGFARYGKNCRATYRTKARMLFDAENLYCNIESFYQRDFEFVPTRKAGPFSRTGIEIFFQPDRGNANYFQIAVAPEADPYTAEGTTPLPMKELKVKIFTDRRAGKRVFNLTIPLKSIGLAGAAAGKEIGFNICCNNYDVPPGFKKEQSTFAVLPSGVGFRIPGSWNTVKFTDSTGPGRVIVSASKNVRLNLIPNPGFQFALPDGKGVPGYDIFGFGKDVYRQEVMAMSNTWYLSAVKNSFNVFRCYFQGLDPAKEYTLKIRARTVNGSNQLSVKQFRWIGKKYVKLDDKRVSLTSEFMNYTLPFHPKHPQVDILFTRYGARGEENQSSMDIASVELYEGKDSVLEIRRDVPVGLKETVPGTGVPVPPNISGERAKPLKVLAFSTNAGSYSCVREIREVFAGTGAVCDILCGTDQKTDIYTTKDDPEQIYKRLTQGEYDLYLLCNEKVLRLVGENTAELIRKNVEKGASLILSYPKKYFVFGKLLDLCRFKDLPGNHPLRGSFPRGFARTVPEDPLKIMTASPLGKGNVFRMNFVTWWCSTILPAREMGSLENLDFPLEDYTKAWLSRMAFLAAGKVDNPIADLKYENGKILVAMEKADGETDADWTLVSASGDRTGSGRFRIRNGKGEFSIPADQTYSGLNLATVRTLDKAGKVLDFRMLAFRKAGPELRITDPAPYHIGNVPAEFSIALSEVPEKSSIVWELADFSGRVLESGRSKAEKEVRLAVPLQNAFTTYNTLRVMLKKQDRVLAKQTLAVMVPERDADRMVNGGFTQRLWGTSGGSTEASSRMMFRSMRGIGVRMIVPAGMGLSALQEGVINGMNFLGGGEIFCIPKQKDHVRERQFNTAKSREEIRERAEKRAESARKFGWSFNCVCDEPKLAAVGKSDELDSHPENIAEFRKRMEKKYGSIAEYNRRMHSDWKSFNEIRPVLMVEARKTGRFGEFIEWRNFNVDRWCEIIKLLSDAGKKVSPHAKFALTNSFGQGIFSGNDYAKLYRRAGLDFATEYSSCIYLGKDPIHNFDEFMRSFAPEMRSPGSVGYANSNAEMISYSPWWFASHRYGGMGWFAMLSNSHQLMDGATLDLTKDALLLGKSLRESKLQQGLGKLFLEYRWKKRDIAIYYSQTSMQTAFLLGKETRSETIDGKGPLHDFFYSRQGAFYALEYLLHQYDFVSYDQVEEGVLKNYKILIMPSIISMTDKEVEAVKAFMANGGKVLADFAPGVYDELGFKRAEAPLKGVDLTGKIFDEMNASCRQELSDYLRKGGVPPLLESENIVKIPGRETMHFTDGVNHVFPILHNASVSRDREKQTFVFPVKGHLYDLRKGKYLGKTDRVTCRIPNADAVLYGVYPGKIRELDIRMPASLKTGSDLKAALEAKMEEGAPGKRVFYLQILDPSGKAAYGMDRCLVAKDGKADFSFRMAFNDPEGIWTLKATDVLTGLTAERKFTLKK